MTCHLCPAPHTTRAPEALVIARRIAPPSAPLCEDCSAAGATLDEDAARRDLDVLREYAATRRCSGCGQLAAHMAREAEVLPGRRVIAPGALLCGDCWGVSEPVAGYPMCVRCLVTVVSEHGRVCRACSTETVRP